MHPQRRYKPPHRRIHSVHALQRVSKPVRRRIHKQRANIRVHKLVQRANKPHRRLNHASLVALLQTRPHVLEQLVLQVHAHVGGAHDGVHMELRSAGQAGDLLGGHVTNQRGLAGLERGVGSGGVLHQQEGDGVGNDLAGIPAAVVVGVLGEHDLLAHSPIGHVVGTIGHIGLGSGGPGIAVGLNGLLLHGAQGGESSQLIEVGAGVAQVYHEGQRIGSFDLQGIGIAVHGFFVAGDHAHGSGGIGSSGVGISNALVSINEVVGVQIGAVGPLQAFTQVEGPGEAILADLVALGLAGLNLVVLVHDQQALKGSDQYVAAIDGAVQRRVDGFGVGSDLYGHIAGGGASGSGAGAAGAGSGRAAAAASHQAECHHGSQHQRQSFFHGWCSSSSSLQSFSCGRSACSAVSPRSRLQSRPFPADSRCGQRPFPPDRFE